MDLCSVLLLPSRTLRWSFLGLAYGLMCDLDIGTENLRWMGDSRLVYGFLRGVVQMKPYKCRLKFKVVETDKIEMARKAREAAKPFISTAKAVRSGTNPLPNRLPEISSSAHETDTQNGVTVDHGATATGVSNGVGDSQEALSNIVPLEPDASWLTIESTEGVRENLWKRKTQEESQNELWPHGTGILYIL
jgi:sphingosine kinase